MLGLWDAGIVLISQVAFFALGWVFRFVWFSIQFIIQVFFMKQLFKDYEVHRRLEQFIFSITFALSCTMFELIIFEIIDVMDTR